MSQSTQPTIAMQPRKIPSPSETILDFFVNPAVNPLAFSWMGWWMNQGKSDGLVRWYDDVPGWLRSVFYYVWHSIPARARDVLTTAWSAENLGPPLVHVLNDGDAWETDDGTVFGKYSGCPNHSLVFFPIMRSLNLRAQKAIVCHELVHAHHYARHRNLGSEADVNRVVKRWGFGSRREICAAIDASLLVIPSEK